ncbi:beta-lactamase family protein [Talaromyces proteolyticus]|uniref:Beta-lactamase family protein n=1 Tax=Talaromyces proteolyticus TaxID=1131652 RepID=A0AAD4KXD2_9EURO|nr:beta-lactamase family protein [Talaromyces proteolyticus]KAH8702249.1 beta-lactamase family protein [Talaromyces proteolyticus]
MTLTTNRREKATLSPATISTLRSCLDSQTSGANPSIAGISYCAVDRNGDFVFSHCSGTIGLGIPRPVTLDTVYWLASCTKLITGIACMQLAEQGKILLDDVDFVEGLSSELRDVKVLVERENGSFELVPKERGITMRMLLTHTSGFGYAFDSAKLRKWAGPVGLDDFGSKDECLYRPLLHQPGTAFEYGVGVDWAGVLVERVTNMSLEQYCQEYIFKPIGIKNISFSPNSDMKSRLAYMHQRESSGTLRLSDHLYRAPLLQGSTAEATEGFCMGGCGCFGTITEYCQIIAAILNDGTSPKTHAQILRPETITEMFTDQIPNLPRYVNEYSDSAKPWLANPCGGPPIHNSNGNVEDDKTEGWGLTFSLSHTTSPIGRAASSASWEGLPNIFWFADRENGVGGIIAAQILPYGDSKVLQCSAEIEKLIYSELKKRVDPAP